MPNFKELVTQVAALSETVAQLSARLSEMQEDRGIADAVGELRRTLTDVQNEVARHAGFYRQEFTDGHPSIPIWSARPGGIEEAGAERAWENAGEGAVEGDEVWVHVEEQATSAVVPGGTVDQVQHIGPSDAIQRGIAETGDGTWIEVTGAVVAHDAKGHHTGAASGQIDHIGPGAAITEGAWEINIADMIKSGTTLFLKRDAKGHAIDFDYE